MTTQHPPSPRRSVLRTALRCLAAALVAGIVVLAVTPGSVHTDPGASGVPSSTISCSSIVAAGWPRTLVSLDDRLTASGVTEADSNETVDARAMCASRRDARLALMVLLGVMASLAVTVSAQASMRSGSSS